MVVSLYYLLAQKSNFKNQKKKIRLKTKNMIFYFFKSRFFPTLAGSR